jgi:hypothetical protein
MAKDEIEKNTRKKIPDGRRKPPKMLLECDDNNVLQIRTHGDYARLDYATAHSEVSGGLVSQIAMVGSQGNRLDVAASNFALGFVDSMAPKDAAEALLFTQMAAVHQATMMMARKLNHATSIAQQDTAERALNKLGRTYAAQMDTLKRYRSKGQTVRVERVTVESGGQAIVGNVTKGGGADHEK